MPPHSFAGAPARFPRRDPTVSLTKPNDTTPHQSTARTGRTIRRGEAPQAGHVPAPPPLRRKIILKIMSQPHEPIRGATTTSPWPLLERQSHFSFRVFLSGQAARSPFRAEADRSPRCSQSCMVTKKGQPASGLYSRTRARQDSRALPSVVRGS